jgi:hypothetical protein
MSARIGQCERDRRADSATRAGHERDLPVEAKWVLIVHGFSSLADSSLALALVAALTRGWLRR